MKREVGNPIQLTGSLSNPVLTTNLFKDGFSAPLNIFKDIYNTFKYD